MNKKSNIPCPTFTEHHVLIRLTVLNPFGQAIKGNVDSTSHLSGEVWFCSVR